MERPNRDDFPYNHIGDMNYKNALSEWFYRTYRNGSKGTYNETDSKPTLFYPQTLRDK